MFFATNYILFMWIFFFKLRHNVKLCTAHLHQCNAECALGIGILVLGLRFAHPAHLHADGETPHEQR